MEKRLKWNAIGLVRKTEILRDHFLEEKKKIPEDHKVKFKTIQGFIDELDYILKTSEKIQLELIPRLEQLFRLSFKTPELVMLALSRPGIKTVYSNLKQYFENKKAKPLTHDDFQELASSGDAANVLALIGDAVLDLAIVQIFWDSSLTTAGKLTQKRKEIVENKNLAKFCDEWKLFEYRLKRTSDSTEHLAKEDSIEHEKGTLVEAIYGIIYLEFGFEELLRTVTLIQ